MVAAIFTIGKNIEISLGAHKIFDQLKFKSEDSEALANVVASLNMVRRKGKEYNSASSKLAKDDCIED